MEPRGPEERVKAAPDDRLPAVPIIVLCVLLALLALSSGMGEPVRVAQDPLVTVGDIAPGAPRADAATPSGASAGEPLRNSLAQALVLTPHRDPDGTLAQAVTAGSNAQVLAKARLRVGDVIYEVDDQPVDERRIGSLAAELSVLDRVEITFKRNGMVRSRVLDLQR